MSRKAKISLIAALAVLIAVFALVYFCFMPEANSGDKSIMFEVTHSDGSTKSIVIETDAENLGEALMQEKLIDAEDGPYGLYVTGVDGEAASEADREYWMFTKDGEMLNTGVSDTMIADGESYEAQIATY